MSSFVHLHNHTHYSLLDGASRIEDLATTAQAYDMPAIAMTDHGNMFGAVEFYKTVKGAGLQPIIGCELYLAPGSRKERRPVRGGERADQTTHFVVLAQNAAGYRNLMKLTSAGYLEGFYYKPRVDMELLEKHSEGLIALSACAKGPLANLVVDGQIDQARAKCGQLKEIFEDRFYLEIQDHGLEFDKPINNAMIDFSREFDLPIVATNDAHYLNREDAPAQDVLVCIQTGKELNDPKRLRFANDSLYFKNSDEMSQLFGHVSGALENTISISESVDFELEMGTFKFPHFPLPEGYDSLDDYLRKLSFDGMKTRYDTITPELTARLEYELGVISQMGYPSYFLIVADIARYAAEEGIPLMTRGSALGCMVAYVLGITNIDPISYGLLFERFLNPERVSMPDIDIDLADRERDKVINYVVEKYGKGSVAQIITFGTMGAKAAIRDVGRVLGMSYGDVDRVAKLVPAELKITLDRAIEKVPELRQMADGGGTESQLIQYAKTLEGLARHASVHAAGVVITPGELTDYVPLYKPSNKDTIVTQYPGELMEDIGLPKMDFLGLQNLSVIQDALAMIKETTGDEIELDDIPLDDPKTLDLFQRGETTGIFQFHSGWLHEFLRRLRPDSVEDLIAMNALCRPGPLNGGVVDDYIDRKHGRKEVTYHHAVMETALKETYGLIVYQEQAMQIARDMAGFTLGRADLLRKAMSKKQPEVMAEERRNFVDGAVENGIDQRIAEEVFGLIEYFGGYAFNKSHSAGYAVLAFQEAYLKVHYPVAFMAALLSNSMSNTEEIVVLINECRKMGIEVLPPDVNGSDKTFAVEGNSIRFGLCAIKNVGQGAVESIVEARKEHGTFEDISGLCENIDLRLVNKRVLESLIQAGACDSLEGHRAQLVEVLDTVIEGAQTRQSDREKGQTSLFELDGTGEAAGLEIHKPVMPFIAPWPASQELGMEKELLGFYVTGHPLKEYEEDLRAFTTAEMRRLDQVNGRQENVVVGGIVTEIKPIVDRNGKTMAFVMLEDFSGSGEVLVFSEPYSMHRELVTIDSLILVHGHISKKEEDNKVIASEIIPLTEARDKLVRSVVVTLNSDQVTDENITSLKDVFGTYPGDCDVMIEVSAPDQDPVSVKTGTTYRVRPADELLKTIRNTIGTKGVRIAGAPPQSGDSGWRPVEMNGRGRNGGGRWRGNGK